MKLTLLLPLLMTMERDSTVVVVRLAVSFAFVQVNNGGILEILGQLFFFPYQLYKSQEFVCKHSPPFPYKFLQGLRQLLALSLLSAPEWLSCRGWGWRLALHSSALAADAQRPRRRWRRACLRLRQNVQPISPRPSTSL